MALGEYLEGEDPFDLVSQTTAQTAAVKKETQDAALMNARLAQWIAEMPSQYYWVHKRFKTRPQGQASVY